MLTSEMRPFGTGGAVAVLASVAATLGYCLWLRTKSV
jgi:uncharacterized membrane protein